MKTSSPISTKPPSAVITPRKISSAFFIARPSWLDDLVEHGEARLELAQVTAARTRRRLECGAEELGVAERGIERGVVDAVVQLLQRFTDAIAELVGLDTGVPARRVT